MSQSKNFHIPSLDGIRAIAAMMVFISHAGEQDLVPGLFGVTIFFFLSGYLITTLLRQEFQATGDLNLRHFYLRRVYRIFPPMYIVLVIMAVLAIYGVVESEMTLEGLLAQFAHLTNYYQIVKGGTGLAPDTGAMWSLAVEEHFYLIFPVALMFLLRRMSYPSAAKMLLGACGMVLAWRCLLVFGFGVDESYTRSATDTRVDSILFGCVMGLWCNPVLDSKLDDVATERQWMGLLVASTALLLFTLLFRGQGFRETFRYSLQGVALFPIFYCAIRYSSWPVFRWLEVSWMRGLGAISYTFYLCHQAILARCERIFRHEPVLAFSVALLFTLLFSIAMYFLVERRMASLRRRLHAV